MYRSPLAALIDTSSPLARAASKKPSRPIARLIVSVALRPFVFMLARRMLAHSSLRLTERRRWVLFMHQLYTIVMHVLGAL